MRRRAFVLALAGVTAALAAWPFVTWNLVRPAVPAVAPIEGSVRDDLDRDGLISFWEGAVRERHPNDMLSPRVLAGEYLQRYREHGDIDDVLRAKRMAERSLAIEPRSIAGFAEMSSIMLTLHRFREALAFTDKDLTYAPNDAGFLAQKASLLMEVGRYDEAGRTLDAVAPHDRGGVAAETVRARYDELTGNLALGRRLLADAIAQSDADPTGSSQGRAWFHFRAGELAFESGDVDGAVAEERTALAIFPDDALADKDLARFELAAGRNREALAAAERGARGIPLPETLGYEADAQAALGETVAAAKTRDLIFAVERIGNAYGVNDRLIAIYYSEHGLRPADALAIARREAKLRGDEIYAQDTLAWAAAMDGRWNEARSAIAIALRHGTEDPLLRYHAAIIALHFGDRVRAESELERCIAANARFNPIYAPRAASILNDMRGTVADSR